jgi:hypothetical protein
VQYCCLLLFFLFVCCCFFANNQNICLFFPQIIKTFLTSYKILCLIECKILTSKLCILLKLGVMLWCFVQSQATFKINLDSNNLEDKGFFISLYFSNMPNTLTSLSSNSYYTCGSVQQLLDSDVITPVLITMAEVCNLRDIIMYKV